MLSFFPRDIFDEILNLIESVSRDFPSYPQKLISSSTPWSVTICQISESYLKQALRYFDHKVVPIQNVDFGKRGITQLKIYGIGSKVNQIIYILFCNYMPNIRILILVVFQIFC